MPRGGKRKGAGRKPTPNTKKKAYGAKLYPEKIEFLRSLKNASKWLDEAIDEKMLNDKSY